jgi:predicted phage terminase large subunit-like protein
MPRTILRPSDLGRLLEQADAEAARRSLAEFVRQAWPIVEPADPYQHNWHVDAVCAHLEAVARGQIRKLVINIPPGHLKSTLVSVCWPAWVWTWRPEWRGLFSSYAQDLAVRDAVKSRTLMDSDWYQRAFILGRGARGGPLWKFSDDMNRKDLFTNSASGMRMSLSVGSKATGFRGNAVVVDDPLNAKDAPSKLARDEVIYWWDKSMSNRINRPDEDAHVIIMQRLHEDDLAGHALRGGGYEHLRLPSEFDSRRRSVTYYRRAPGAEPEELHRDPRQVDGELLFPARFGARYLAEQRASLGSEGYAGQHDQDPAPPSGGMFKVGWWRFWRHEGSGTGEVAGTSVALDAATHPRPPECDPRPARVIPDRVSLVGSIDAAFKGTDTSDFVVIGVWAVAGAERYLLDLARGRWDYVATKRELLRMAAKWSKCLRWLVEDKANGSAIISELQGQVLGILAVNPEGGKEARAAAVTPLVEAGQVFLPEGAPWVREFVGECALFPRGKNDDQVDMMSQALIHLVTSREVARAAMLWS